MTALLCVTINGPISMNITGIFKDVYLTFAGFFFFADTKVTPASIVGMSFSFFGASYFCYKKYEDSQKAAAVEAKKVGKSKWANLDREWTKEVQEINI